MKKALILALTLAPILVFGQSAGDDKTTPDQANTKAPIIVSVNANAKDIRSIIAELFSQAKLNYVLQPAIQGALYLSLDKVDFDVALNIVCDQAKLQVQVQNGIYFITKKPVVAVAMPPTPKGTLDKSVLIRKISGKFTKTDMRLVLTALGKQADVMIEVDKSVPNYKLDVKLNHATLRFALDKVTEAANLKYKFTDNKSILIYKPVNPNDVVSVAGN